MQLTFLRLGVRAVLNELGLSTSQIGFVLSLLPFAGLLALVVRRRWLTLATSGPTSPFLHPPCCDSVPAADPVVVMRYGTDAAGLRDGNRRRVRGAASDWRHRQLPMDAGIRAQLGARQYTATNNLASTLTGFLAISLASAVLARSSGLLGYDVIIGVGVICGMIAVGFAAFIPGAPQKSARGAAAPGDLRRLAGSDAEALPARGWPDDRGHGPAGLIPAALHAREVGLTSSDVVGLQRCGSGCALLSSFLWGWAADRYGSKPVALLGCVSASRVAHRLAADAAILR